MYKKALDFIKYNNAFTIIFVLCFFSFGITYAASPTVRDSVYSSQETVVSIDNKAIVSADLDNLDFNLRIGSITEDGKDYFVAYSYQTLAIENSVWQNKEVNKTLTVDKEALDGKDLGLYVAKQLGENIDYELSYLKRVKKLEQDKGESQKVVTVEYSGLIGKLLNPEEKVIEGYSPVIPEAVPEVAATVESNPADVIVSAKHAQPQETPTVATTSSPVVNEQLVHDVVGELLQGQATSTAVSEPATSTPDIIPVATSTSPEATSTPVEATSTPPATSTPDITPEATSTMSETTIPPETTGAAEATSTPEVAP